MSRARLQDHDRALILGEKTFGKGLVQTVYPLSDDTGLALTWAHFYTPSGRLIQRDYSNKSFYDYYFHRDEDARNPVDVKMTDAGARCTAGAESRRTRSTKREKLDQTAERVDRATGSSISRGLFRQARTSLPKGWMPDDAVLGELKSYLRS